MLNSCCSHALTALARYNQRANRVYIRVTGTDIDEFISDTKQKQCHGAMAEAGWDEVTHVRKRPMKAAEARSQRVIF